jgi:hypothetical protein
VRLSDDRGKPLTSVYLGLSDDEADELIGAVSALKSAHKGWHEHVGDETHRREITVYREDDDTAIFAEPS